MHNENPTPDQPGSTPPPPPGSTPPPPPGAPPPGSTPPPYEAGASVPPPGVPGQDERMWGMFAHLAALLGGLLSSWLAGLGVFIGPLIVWLVKKDSMPFVDDQGKEALNFNITVAIGALILVLISIVTLGIGLLLTVPLGVALGIFWLVFTIIAAIKANEGVAYRYPFAIRLIK